MKKLVALFAATTMAMSLSVSAFAATYDAGTITFEEGDFVTDDAQKTVMAYVVSGTADSEGVAYSKDNAPAYDANATMVALDQAAAIESVVIDSTKYGEDSTLVIKTSGSSGQVVATVLTKEAAPTSYNVTYVNADGTTNVATVTEGTTIKAFIESLTEPTKAADNDYTYTFAGWYTDAELTVAVDKTSEEDVSTLAVENTITLYAKYDATAIESGDDEEETTTIVVGDVNGDGSATAADATVIKLYAAKRTTTQKATVNTNNNSNVGETITLSDGTTYVVGDVNGDGSATAADATVIKLYAAKRTATQKATVNTNNNSNVGETLTY